jgi:DNA-directed RNA polymerase specialized sigma24 family protein
MQALHSNQNPAQAARFATTHWSVVRAAQDRQAPEASEALADLCAVYWPPLYAFVRRQGFPEDKAQDLTQEFFARLLEKDYLGAAARDRGKFRSYLLACLGHFLANEQDRNRAHKRGGGTIHLSLDFCRVAGEPGLEPSHALTAERLFERRWAMTLLAQVLGRLQEEFTRAGRGPVFEGLKAFLTGEGAPLRYQQAAEQLGMTVPTVTVAIHRLRRRYRDLLREEIGRTVADPGDIDDEIRALFAALG